MGKNATEQAKLLDVQSLNLQVGQTLVFMKEEVQLLLDSQLNQKFLKHCIKIQAAWRGHWQRDIFLLKKLLINKIKYSLK